MKRNKPSLRQKMALKAVDWSKKIAVKKSEKEMIKISDKYRSFINEIQEKCADIIELEPENKQSSIVTTICANIIQGFDTKKEMDLVIDMIQNAINEYWKNDEIPQKGGVKIDEYDRDNNNEN